MEALSQITESNPLVKAVGVKRIFGKGDSAVHALKGANFSIPSGRLVALRGPSGSGKTTLINLLGALDSPTEGTVYFNGQEISGISSQKRNEIRRVNMG